MGGGGGSSVPESLAYFPASAFRPFLAVNLTAKPRHSASLGKGVYVRGWFREEKNQSKISQSLQSHPTPS